MGPVNLQGENFTQQKMVLQYEIDAMQHISAMSMHSRKLSKSAVDRRAKKISKYLFSLILFLKLRIASLA